MPVTQKGGFPPILGGSFIAPLGGGRRGSRSRSRSHVFRTMKRRVRSSKTKKSAKPWWKVW